MDGRMSWFDDVSPALLDVVYVLQVEPEFRLIHVSDSVLELTGYTSQEYLADPVLWRSAPDPRDRHLIESVIEAEPGSSNHVTMRWAGRGGSAVWTHQITRKVVREDGSVVLLGALNRLTARQIIEAQAGIDGRYRLLAEDASDIVLQTDLDGRIVWVSDSAEALTGWSAESLVGRRSRSLVDEQDYALATQVRHDVLRGASHSGVILRIRTVDGGRRYVSLTARPAHDQHGGVSGGILSLRDIDEVMRARLAAESERQVLRATLDAMLDPLVFLTSVRDLDGRIMDFLFREANPAACQVLGLPREQLVGDRLSNVLPRLFDSWMTERLVACVDGGEPLVLNNHPEVRDSGEVGYFDLRAVAVQDGLTITWRDVTERFEEAEALVLSQRRYRLLAEHATDVVYRTSLDGVTEWISEGVERILGFPPDHYIGRSGRDIVSPEDRDFVDVIMAEVLAGTRQSARFRMPTKDGGTRWVDATVHAVRDDDGRPIGFVGGWRDVHAEVEAGRVLDRQARTDDLTGLLNRREVFAHLAERLRPGETPSDRVAVAFCDLDGFKSINDRMGHAVGDRMLQVVSQRIRGCLRGHDLVARVGGDEFLLVLGGVSTPEAAVTVAEKVRRAVRAPLRINGFEVPASVSVGVTLADDHDDLEALVARADRAMYLAKEAGRDQVVPLG